MIMSLPPIANFANIEGWIIVLVFALLVFGPKKIPELMRGLGRGMGELQKGIEDGKRMLQDATHVDDHAVSSSATMASPSHEPALAHAEATSSTSTSPHAEPEQKAESASPAHSA